MDMGRFNKIFDSIEEFIAFGSKTKDHAEYGSFAGEVASWEELEDMAYNGWKTGAERAERLRLEIVDRIESFGLEGLDAVESYDVSGAFVDVGAFCEGEPECMVEYEEQLMPRQRVARIFVQINYLGNVSCAEAERRGVAIAAIVDALEAHGMQCEVWGVDYSYGAHAKGGGYHQHAVCIKSAGQLMPLDRIAFAVGHPGFYRAGSFAVRAGISGSEWGRSSPFLEEWADEGELVIGLIEKGEPQWASDDAAIEWVCDHVTKFVEKVTT